MNGSADICYLGSLYCTSSKKSFCALVEVSGEKRVKYKRLMNMKISETAITRSDFAKLKEDLQFLDKAMKTVLAAYQDYFRERFMDGLSIRKYAEAHQLNRGSVDYQQKRFFSALASLLKERDEAEGTCRLRKPAQK